MYNITDIMDVLSDNTTEKLFIEHPDLFFEGAVKRSKKEKLDKYFNKYNYVGDENSGTITVDGVKYKIIRKQPSIQALTYNKNENIIELNDDEFKALKNNKRRDAILQHEIAHLQNHKPSDRDASFKRKKEIRMTGMYGGMHDSGYDVKSKSVENQVKTSANVATVGSYITSPPKKKDEETKEKNKIKDENLDKYKKYEKRGTHVNALEFEADAYASQQKNGEHGKRALRDLHKYNKKDDKKIDKKVNEELKYRKSIDPNSKDTFDNLKKEYKREFNKNMVEDITQRSKAAKDKTIDKTVYKKS